MKKIIILVSMLILFCGILLYYINRTVSVITLDINPSIEIRLKANGKVKMVKALNKDAKKIVTSNLKNKSFDEIIDTISENSVVNGYIGGDKSSIIVSSIGNINLDEVKKTVQESFGKRNVITNVIVIEEITKDDKKLAKKHNITPAKAAYISDMLKENENLTIETLANKPVDELKETKESGNYCLGGYTLEGTRCYKEISRKTPEIGPICPDGYYEYNGKCYEEVGSIETDELGCPTGLTLNSENKCTGVKQGEVIANFSCNTGLLIKRSEIKIPSIREVGDNDEYLCEDRSNASYPTERCYLQEHAIINGKCAMGPKPLLPTLTGCEGHDINYNGGCYDPAPDEPYVCPNGDRYDDNSELCPDTFTYTKAEGNYSCNIGYTLNGTKCEQEVMEEPYHKRVCPSGYTLVNDGRCINTSVTKEHINGNVCSGIDTRLVNNMCVTFRYVDAMHN